MLSIEEHFLEGRGSISFFALSDGEHVARGCGSARWITSVSATAIRVPTPGEWGPCRQLRALTPALECTPLLMP